MTTQSLTLFKSRALSCSFTTPQGVQVVFQKGRYATSNTKIIETLKEEIEAGNPLIYIDPEEPTADAIVSTVEVRTVEAVSKGMVSSDAASKKSVQDSISALSDSIKK